MKKYLIIVALAGISAFFACNKENEPVKPVVPTEHVFEYTLNKTNNCGLGLEYWAKNSVSDSAIVANKADKMTLKLACTDLYGSSRGDIRLNINRVATAAKKYGMELPPVDVWLNKAGYRDLKDTLATINITGKIRE